MTCRSARLAEFGVSGPLALTGLVARIGLFPLLVRLPAVRLVRFVRPAQPAHPVAAYSQCLARRPARSVLAAVVAGA